MHLFKMRISASLLGSHLWSAFVFIALLKLSPSTSTWPKGTYGIPAEKSGCPADYIDKKTSMWTTGSRLHQTEKGSHSSRNNHLFGMDGDGERYSHVHQRFCMKMTHRSDDKYHFMPGKYCIFKKNDCPPKFKEGWIYWDDAAPWFSTTIQDVSGTLPDGEYNRNTKIEYCCRNDGVTHEAVFLPPYQPFFLLKFGDTCQEVAGMDVSEEWINWSGEKSINRDSTGGLHPTIEREENPNPFTKLFYCYYVPKPNDKINGEHFSWDTFLKIMYVLGAIVGIVFLVASILTAVTYRHPRNNRTTMVGGLSDGNSDQSHSQSNLLPLGPRILNRGQIYSTRDSCNTEVIANATNMKKISDLATNKGNTITSQTAVDDGTPSLGSLSLFPDADSEAPPSYDEVLRERSDNNVLL